MENKISSKKIISSMTWSFSEKLLTDIVETLVTIILSRLLLPRDYGLVALVQIFINISLIFVNSGLSTALIQKKDATEKQVSTIFYLNLLLGIFIYAILFFISPIIANFRKNQILCPLFRVLALKIPISSVYSMQHAQIKKKMDFRKYFFSSLAGTITSGIIGIYLACKGFGAWALVASTLIDQIMDSVILFLSTGWLPKIEISYNESKELILFGFKIFVKELIFRTYNQMHSFVIGIKYNSEDLAFSSKGQKLPQMIADLTESTIVRVMFPVFSSLQDEKSKVKEMVRITTSVSLFFIVPIVFGFAIVSSRAISIIFTDKWLPCIPYLRIYCISTLLFQVTRTEIRAIEAFGKGNYLLKMQIIDVVFGMTVLFLTVFVFDNPIYIVFGSLISTIVSTIVTINYSKLTIGYGFTDHINDIKSTVFISTIMGIIVYFVGFISLNETLVLIIQVIVGIITYFLLSIMFKTKPFIFVLDFIKNIKRGI